MKRRLNVVWWWWLVTGTALGGRLGGWGQGLALAMALTVLQAIHLAVRTARSTSLPVQVRASYLALLVMGSWPPLAFLHAAQLAGTIALLVFDYCPLARTLSLFPWNRRGPLTLARLRATFLTPPVRGSILEALDRPAAPAEVAPAENVPRIFIDRRARPALGRTKHDADTDTTGARRG
jgi:hypothetical protein